MFENSDDYDFAPVQNSTLSSLFNSSVNPTEDVTDSLKYIPPKQPKSGKTPEPKTKAQCNVFFAKIVSLWKLEEGKYKYLGKHGLAIIGLDEQSKYEMIIYKERNNIVTRIVLNKIFKLLLQDDNFFTFFDSSEQNWLIKFENVDDKNTFTSESEKYSIQIVDKQNKSSVESMELPEKPSTNQTRADILSRVTKIGMQILPYEKSKEMSTDMSDSEIEESMSDRKVLPRKSKKIEKTAITSSSQLVPSQQSETFMHQPLVFSQPVGYDPLTLLMNQNMEMKFTLSQMNAKLEGIVKDSTDSSGMNPQSKLKVLELKLENIRSELDETKKKYYDLQLEHEKLQQKQVGDVKLETVLKEELDHFKKSMEVQKVKLKDYDRVCEENKQLQNLTEEQSATIDNLKLKLRDFEEYYEKNESEKVKNKATLQELTNQVSDLKLTLSKFEERHMNRASDVDEQMQAINSLIKRSMNRTYESIKETFDESEEYLGDVIYVAIGKEIKLGTYQILQELPNYIYNLKESNDLKTE